MAMAQQQTGFAEVTPMVHPFADVAVTVRISGAEADIHSGADAETASMVLQLLKTANCADLKDPDVIQSLLPWNATAECRVK